ncbi:glycogen synthase GlgA [Intestinimonas massiliensis]|uniref:Glycogen synthase n=1 Tax=Intestinimonas massiliensis (ex Afouda et al. 2020) TaxID=1673721 RepID=A0AAW5JG14_9FIRM|nr:glycogen synthase GlgA [Intestinimonas massiliensis (ex Afouda et al. 2020)]MCQ4768956.1 glycogen synthase GlgA [Intestinimonas massiliensis (ex Afouda et al. 2020)]
MNILFAASEVAPFIKTGGLADVAGSLPKHLAAQGHDVKVILPLYEGIGPEWRKQMKFLLHFNVRVAWRNPYCGLFELRRDNVSYLFVDNEYYFKRAAIYGHYDDGERFTYFSRAIVETPAHLDWHPDVIHCNDWQTALVPIYLLEERERVWELRGTKSVFTIHNIEYQGRYGDQVLEDLLGLNKGYMNEHMLAYYGDVNLMKGAIFAADYVTTVSPTYAGELQYPFYAHGLEGVIAHNGYKMRGILNGLDTGLYDPAQDKGLAMCYSAGNLEGKKACKAALQQAVGLREDPNVPIIACISRLVKHKGFDLVTAAIHEIMGMDVQMVVLGTGEWNYEEAFRHAESQYPSRFAARIQYSAALSTAIYGGADIFLMPSISEPCGLSQMIAMRYGTVPVVRETGGLKDTVPPYRWDAGEGRGFSFADINAHDMVWVIREAVDLYHQNQAAWKKLQIAGMTADFSWDGPAREYEDIYCSITGLPRPEPAAAAEPEPIPEKPASQPTIPAEAAEAAPAPAEEPPAQAPQTAGEPAPQKAAAKKPAARKSAAKAEKAAGKKPAARKSAAKKPAARQAEPDKPEG